MAEKVLPERGRIFWKTHNSAKENYKKEGAAERHC